MWVMWSARTNAEILSRLSGLCARGAEGDIFFSEVVLFFSEVDEITSEVVFVISEMSKRPA